MGQKTHPIGVRLILNKKWSSRWFAKTDKYGDYVAEDAKIRKHLLSKAPCAGNASSIIIQRTNEKLEVTICTPKPGPIIGKKGAEIELIKQELLKLTSSKEIWVDVVEIKKPDADAKLVAEKMAKQLEQRASFRRVMKKALEAAKAAGAQGIRVAVAGRIGGAEIARTESYKEGRTPLHTLRADIDYGTAEAHTTYGIIGVKVWINKGE